MMAVTRMDGRNSRRCAGRGFRNGLLEQGGGCVGGLFAAVYWQEAGLGRDENGVGVELLNDEMQCVDFGCGCGVELNRFLQ